MVSLDRPDQDGVCQGSSTLEFVKYMQHPLIALNFKVEYSASLPTLPSPTSVTYTIAWSTHLPELNQHKEVLNTTVDFFCTMGPGNSATRDLLWGIDSTQVDTM